MKRLVLDKSFVKAAPRGLIADLRKRFDFLLPDTLLHEIATEKLDKRRTLSRSEITRLDKMIRANFVRAIEEAGNVWIDNETSLGWEMTEGKSAREALGFALKVTPSIDMLSPKDIQACLDDDLRKQNLVSVAHAPPDQAGFERIRSLSERELFHMIQEDFTSPETHQKVARSAQEGFAEMAPARGLVVSAAFRPTQGWFAFGIMLAAWSYLPWKFWKYGDDPAPANAWYDLVYRGYLAVTDGIVSADRDLLKLSWACWPEKRGDIYDYNMAAGEMVRFEPQWSS